MCLICFQKPGDNLLPEDYLSAAWDNNNDGGGIMWVDNDGRLMCHKVLKNKAKFVETYYVIRDRYPESPIGWHVRIATHGTISIRNVHPHFINRNSAMMHNGIFGDFAPERGNTKSDSAIFSEYILSNLPKDFADSPFILEMLNSATLNNKVLILNSDRSHVILGEKRGNWHSKIPDTWFSNYSYLTRTTSMSRRSYIMIDNDYVHDEKCTMCQYPLKTIKEINKGSCDSCYEIMTKQDDSKDGGNKA